jgi:hypothetical protein
MWKETENFYSFQSIFVGAGEYNGCYFGYNAAYVNEMEVAWLQQLH